MSPIVVRYIVNDVDAAIEFYRDFLDFEVEMHPAPGFAMLSREDLLLALNAVGGPGGASQPMPDGRVPGPGGWNRVQVRVGDLESVVQELRTRGASFRNDIVDGMGGRQILVDDPSGNCIELFQPHEQP
jgi:catechol 2,3-dioxygenase-like lactoylglutathione lyase family enzyme